MNNELTMQDAQEIYQSIIGGVNKAIKANSASGLKSSIATVISADNDIGTAIVRLKASPDNENQNMELANLSFKQLAEGDDVWVYYWGSLSNAFIGLANHLPSLSDVKTYIGVDNIDYNTRKNILFNGGFDVWQRGITQTTSGYGSDDRWNNLHSDATTKTHSQQAFTVGQTDVPDNPTYYSRTIVVSGNTATSRCVKYQNIEDVIKFSGKNLTLQFWAKANASKQIAVEFNQVFGTGGSTSILGINPTKVNLTTSWQFYSITTLMPSVSGKTIGANNSTGIVFWFDAGSNFNSRTNSLGNQSGTFDLAQVQLNFGSIAMPFEIRNITDELILCQRYAQTRTTNTVADMDLRPRMRITPTKTAISGGYLYDAEL